MASARDQDESRYEALKRAVANIALIRRGSLVRRLMPCGKPRCRCQARPPQLHGPYYQWTRKVRGKTVTVRVSKGEVALLKEWIENGRRLDKLVGAMERVSYRLTERLLREARKPSARAAAQLATQPTLRRSRLPKNHGESAQRR